MAQTAAQLRKAAVEKATAANNKQNPDLPKDSAPDADQARRDRVPNPTRTTLTGAMRTELMEKTGEQVLALLTDLTSAKAAGEFLRKIINEQGGERGCKAHDLCAQQLKTDLGRLQSHLKLLYDEIY